MEDKYSLHMIRVPLFLSTQAPIEGARGHSPKSARTAAPAAPGRRPPPSWPLARASQAVPPGSPTGSFLPCLPPSLRPGLLACLRLPNAPGRGGAGRGGTGLAGWPEQAEGRCRQPRRSAPPLLPLNPAGASAAVRDAAAGRSVLRRLRGRATDSRVFLPRTEPRASASDWPDSMPGPPSSVYTLVHTTR